LRIWTRQTGLSWGSIARLLQNASIVGANLCVSETENALANDQIRDNIAREKVSLH
jgi:hypothetical protein